MRPLSSQKRRIYFIVFAIVFIVCIPVVILYAVGYRLDATFAPFRTGGILVQNQFSDAQIVLNGVLEKRTNIFQRNIFLDNLKPGLYTIEVIKDGYQPWKQHLPVVVEQVSPTVVFMLPTNITFATVTPMIVATPATTIGTTTVATTSKKKVAIPEANPDYPLAQKLFAVASSTSATTTRLFQKVALVQGTSTVNMIWTGLLSDAPYQFCFIDICRETILLPLSYADRIDFYPGRNDVVVISRGGKIYAQQLDIRDLPPAQQIYSGEKPDFRFDGETIYVRDGKTLFKAEL